MTKHDIKNKKVETQSDKYKKWFATLLFGTTDRGRQELIDCNETHSLIRIKHKGSWSGALSANTAGYTEWVVALNYEYDNASYGTPKAAWSTCGRLLKSDKTHILKRFKLSGTNNCLSNSEQLMCENCDCWKQTRLMCS